MLKYITINDDEEYTMASSLFILSERSGEDFAKGKAFKVIHEKAKKVSCSNETIDTEMSFYFKGKGVIDLREKLMQICLELLLKKNNNFPVKLIIQ